MKLDEANHLRGLESENAKLKLLVAELSLEKQILKDEAEGQSGNPQMLCHTPEWFEVGSDEETRKEMPPGNRVTEETGYFPVADNQSILRVRPFNE